MAVEGAGFGAGQAGMPLLTAGSMTGVGQVSRGAAGELRGCAVIVA